MIREKRIELNVNFNLKTHKLNSQNIEIQLHFFYYINEQYSHPIRY
jgi:hypothetical protein